MTSGVAGRDLHAERRRLAVVTGAASGIGRAAALALAGAGFDLVAADVDEMGARRTAEQAGDAGRRASGLTVDVSSAESTREFAQAVLRGAGVPWAVVNCAGWDETRPFVETERPFWERVVAVNYLGVVAVTHEFLPGMIERGDGGRVINVASDAGRVGSSGETVYAGAKGGVIAFTKSVAREVARHGITANAVCPGPTDTPLFRAQPERLQQALERAIPLRRLGRPEDVAGAVAYFASGAAEFVTGQVLSVSGGLTMAG
jgi:2-hydroxycyclohexanecarboxyl-CoA dehydrogenase